MSRRGRTLSWAGAILLWAAVASGAAAQMGPPRPGPRCLPGSYDGGQTEMAAELELRSDNRFRYTLSYGALDEVAEGKWETDGAGVLLTSDPTTPPGFTLLGERPASPGQLRVTLDVPRGISRQYFSVLVRFADGRSSVRQLQEEGLTLALGANEQPVSLTLLLSVLSLESEAFKLSVGSGSDVHLRFDPNDLGKVAFDRTALRFDQEDLLLERHDRLIRFRRSGEGCESPSG